MMIELHSHTHYSDGRATPEALVKHAAQIGIKTLAITDHDNIRGNQEAQPFAEQAGIELIPAVELTTHWNDLVDVDVLAYFVDFTNANFQAMITDALNDHRQRMTLCCEVVTRNGYPVSYDEIELSNPRYVGAVHLSNQLYQVKGVIPDFATGVAIFRAAWSEVRRGVLSIEDAIQTVNSSGGVAVLAHPVRVRADWLTAEEIKPLVDMGLGGIEVYHPSANKEANAYFKQIAEAFDLVTTGGSDEHGYPDGFPRLGTQPITPQIVEALRQRANNPHI
ncbi:MAG: PHP domain-containing protein [Aggregatilineales bacterium]